MRSLLLRRWASLIRVDVHRPELWEVVDAFRVGLTESQVQALVEEVQRMAALEAEKLEQRGRA
jgi:hypothetical protein